MSAYNVTVIRDDDTEVEVEIEISFTKEGNHKHYYVESVKPIDPSITLTKKEEEQAQEEAFYRLDNE